MTGELSEKQKKFGREYMVDFNVADAYVRAGYSKNGAQSGGSRLLRDTRIQAYIAELEAEATERAGLTIDGVLKNLREDRKAARAANQYEPAVRADELLGKYLAMLTDVSKNVGVDDIPPEEMVRDACTKNGVLNERALAAGLEWLRPLRAPVSPRNEDPTEPDPEARH